MGILACMCLACLLCLLRLLFEGLPGTGLLAVVFAGLFSVCIWQLGRDLRWLVLHGRHSAPVPPTPPVPPTLLALVALLSLGALAPACETDAVTSPSRIPAAVEPASVLAVAEAERRGYTQVIFLEDRAFGSLHDCPGGTAVWLSARKRAAGPTAREVEAGRPVLDLGTLQTELFACCRAGRCTVREATSADRRGGGSW
jgi:hypothetical protein